MIYPPDIFLLWPSFVISIPNPIRSFNHLGFRISRKGGLSVFDHTRLLRLAEGSLSPPNLRLAARTRL